MGGDYDVLFIGHTPAKIGEAYYNINIYTTPIKRKSS
jgi:hypothetical protein